jgi:hypothetical protein
MIVAIHQPNYAPWLGYFRKIAIADVFVFLDDVQFSKGSYTNRVKISAEGQPRWLTVPVSFAFGDPINGVRFGDESWTAAHLSRLHSAYRGAPAFDAVWPAIAAIYEKLSGDNLASVNIDMITKLAESLGLATRFLRSSDIEVSDARADDRLVAIVAALAPGGTYLSGKGGAGYQDPEKYAQAGIELRYAEYAALPYPQQGSAEFVPGLSVLDAVFNLGWDGTAERLAS